MAKRPKRSAAATAQTRIRWPYVAAATLALAGLADATYLAVIALTGETAVCGNSTGCFEVLGSSYAKLDGIPLGAFGVFGYFAVFSCAVFAAFGRGPAERYFRWIVGVMFLVTLWLLFVQAFLLHAFCRYCLLSAAIVMLLAGLAVAIPPRK